MPTVAEILKSTGFTDEQISALDARAVTAFTNVLTTAETAQQTAAAAATKAEADRVAMEKAKSEAESTQRGNVKFYEETIVPGLTDGDALQKKLQTEKANAEAMALFYKTQIDGAKAAGYLAADAPAFALPVDNPANPGVRDASGRFVAGTPGGTPGSPTFTMDDVRNGLGATMGTLSDIQWKYQQLYGRPMPISPTELVRQSEANKFKDPATYASQIFKFSEKEEEIRLATAKKHDEDIAASTAAAKDAEWKVVLEKERAENAAKERARAEQGGNNPDVRTPPGSSKFAEVKRAVQEGTMPDPLKMTDAQRRVATRQQIHKDIEERVAAVA